MFAMLEPPDRHYYRTVKVGQTVKFPCHTKLPEDIDWVRIGLEDGTETFIYLGSLGPRDLGLNPRFKVLDKNHSHSLVIYNVTVDDSANYRCAEHNGLGNKHFYLLTVQGNFMFLPPRRRLCFILCLFLWQLSTNFDGFLSCGILTRN